MVRKTYEHISLKKDRKIETRKEAALLAQLRSGHCLKLAHYQNRIDNTKSDMCPRCGEEAETVTHWIKCPANIKDRIDIFGKASVDLGALTKHPAEALAYARVTFN